LVQDVPSYINAADICIAPIRFGSGTRLKILEWMACERPIIASSKAVEGLDVKNGVHLIVEDDFSKYPECISALLNDESLARRLGTNARTLIESKYDWSICVSPLVSLIRENISHGITAQQKKIF
jgi:glycosyltransferase involved in cell wall biosynthesis